jgi:SAM-dependent methyltransferase
MAAPMETSTYADLRFTTRQDAAEFLVERAMPYINERANPCLMDLGCGTGAVAMAAVRARLDLRTIAVDVSSPNVRSAREKAAAAGFGNRMTAVCEDYMRWKGEKVDLIISDSVLQLVSGSNTALAARLSSDLRPGGILLATMPIVSFGNILLIILRRLWTLLPAFADDLALRLAIRIYPNFHPDALRERIAYLRITPVRWFGPALVEEFSKHGLDFISAENLESTSIAKLQHQLLTWRRR